MDHTINERVYDDHDDNNITITVIIIIKNALVKQLVVKNIDNSGCDGDGVLLKRERKLKFKHKCHRKFEEFLMISYHSLKKKKKPQKIITNSGHKNRLFLKVIFKTILK